MEKIWKNIPGYNGIYQVSNSGKVRSYAGHKGFGRRTEPIYLKEREISGGYKQVTLSKDNKRYQKLVHRLVAQAFIPNPKNKPEVNHIDGDRGNNVFANLEWVTRSENVRHAIYITRSDMSHKKIKCVETGKKYKSIRSAAKDVGCSASQLSAVLNKKENRELVSRKHWVVI